MIEWTGPPTYNYNICVGRRLDLTTTVLFFEKITFTACCPMLVCAVCRRMRCGGSNDNS